MFGSKQKVGACLVLLCALGGCATESGNSTSSGPCSIFPSDDKERIITFPSDDAEKIIKLHTLDVDNHGETRDFKNRFSTILGGFEAYKKCRKEKKLPVRLLIFAHGGLNSVNEAKRQAVEQAHLMREDGYYPVFLIWRTSPFDTYWDQIAHVRKGDYSELPSPTFPLYLVGDLGQGLARAPVNLKDQIKLFWSSEVAQDEAFKIDEDYARKSRNDKESIYYNVALPQDFRGTREISLENAFKEALYVLLTPVCGVATIFLDPIGKTTWENMVRRALSSIHRADEFLVCEGKQDNDPQCMERAKKENERLEYPHGSGGFSKLFQELEDCFAKRSAEQTTGAGRACLRGKDGESVLDGVKVTLIGHSMGTIIFNELASLYPNIPYENIVYMASASSIRHFMDTIMPLVRSRQCVKFHSLMLHPLAEARERSFHQGAAPSGTLLEWIDEMYEPSVTPLDRTLGKWRNIRVAKHLLEEDAKLRINFKIFGFGKNDPVEHEDFNDTDLKYWLPMFWGEVSNSGQDCKK